MPINHPFTSPVTDEGDPDLVGPDEWNDDHTLPDADEIPYDNTTSGLTADNVQDAIDELAVTGEAPLSRAHGQFLAIYHRDSDDAEIVMTSEDGVNFTTLDTVSLTSRDPSIIHYDGRWWMAITGAGTFGVVVSDDLDNWSGVSGTPFTPGGLSGIDKCWAPEWFVDPETGDIHLFMAITTDDEATFLLYETHPTNRGMTAWANVTQITGTSLPTRMIDPFMVYAPEMGTSGKPYKLWYKDEANKHLEYMESASLTSGFTVVEDGDWASWNVNKDGGANSIEAPCLVKLDDGRWRIYFNENNGLNSVRTVYSDSIDGWATWTEQEPIVHDNTLLAQGTVIRLRSAYDHERDPHAHPNLTGPSGASALGDLTDVSLSSEAAGDQLRYNGTAWVNTGPLILVDQGTLTIDDGDPFGLTLTSVWGIDGTTPYYDDANVDAGDEAALFYDPLTNKYVLVAYDF